MESNVDELLSETRLETADEELLDTRLEELDSEDESVAEELKDRRMKAQMFDNQASNLGERADELESRADEKGQRAERLDAEVEETTEQLETSREQLARTGRGDRIVPEAVHGFADRVRRGEGPPRIASLGPHGLP